MNKNLVLEVGNILSELSKLDKSKIKLQEDGNMDMKSFYQIKEVKSAIEKLEKLKVNTNWLFKNGYPAAGMLLRIK